MHRHDRMSPTPFALRKTKSAHIADIPSVIQIRFDRGDLHVGVDDGCTICLAHHPCPRTNRYTQTRSHSLWYRIPVVCSHQQHYRHDRLSVRTKSPMVPGGQVHLLTRQMLDRFRVRNVRSLCTTLPYRTVPLHRPSTWNRQSNVLCIRSDHRPGSRSAVQQNDGMEVDDDHRRGSCWVHGCLQSVCTLARRHERQ